MGATLVETVVFFILAIFIVVMSIMTVTTKRNLRAATYLLAVLFATAGIYFLLGYNFLGAIQIMVYAGGIVVLYVFSILLTSGKSDKAEELKKSKLFTGIVTTAAGLAVILFVTLKHEFITHAAPIQLETGLNEVGLALVSSDKYGFMLAFEALSVFLLACIVGSILIARKR